jgi:hypothetical protein
MRVLGSKSAFSLKSEFRLVGSAMYSYLMMSAAPYMTINSISPRELFKLSLPPKFFDDI